MKKEELQKLGMSIYGRIKQAIERGEKDKALELTEEAFRAKMDSENSMVRWIDLLMTIVADKLGEEAIFKAHKKLDDLAVRRNFASQNEAPEVRVRKRAYVWNSIHGIDVNIEEDEEKFIFRFACSSGGSLRASGQCGKTRQAHPWSYDQTGLAYYCTHCPTIFEVKRIEEFGYPDWVTFPQEGGECVQVLYKDPRNTPAEYYKRVGKEKS